VKNEKLEMLAHQYIEVEDNLHHKFMHLAHHFRDITMSDGEINPEDPHFEIFVRMLDNSLKYNGKCEDF
jgi:hypothetical protein